MNIISGKKFSFIIFLIVFSFFTQVTEEFFLRILSGICKPPKGNICVSIRECPFFNKLLITTPLLPRKLISFQCGFQDNLPKVCCFLQTMEVAETTTGSIVTTTEPIATVDPIRTVRFLGTDEISVFEHKNLKFLPLDICGVIQTDSRITNGQKAALNEFPWMVLIFYKNADGVIDFRCGGTLVNEKFVLTAAHCVVNQPVVGVRLGEYNVDTSKDCDSITGYCAPPTQDFQIEQFFVHPFYDIQINLNDIALIKIKGIANIESENVKPICLPVNYELQTNSAVVSGWGVTENGYKSQILLQARVPIVPTIKCQMLYQHSAQISSTQICAGGYKGKDSCGGDSGGPLMEVVDINGTLRFIQYGIVSFGPKSCGVDSKPGVYTNVSSFMKWILDNLDG